MERRLPRRGSGDDTRDRLLSWLGWAYLIIAITVVWVAVSDAYKGVVPGPGETLRALREIGAERILQGVRVTLSNSLLGYGVALAASLASITLAYLNRHLDAFFNSLNTFIQSVSVLVWAIVLVMIFGVTSRKPPILVVAAATYPILLSSLYSGVQALDDQYKLLARILGASRVQELAYFILPGIIPYLAGASRAAIGIALRISVVAEAFGASGGVGYWLVYSYDYGYKEGVFAWAWILIALMIAVDLALLRPIERWTLRWKQMTR